MRLGVPQLSLGEKAVLTATPDYVRDFLRSFVCHTYDFHWYVGIWFSWLPTSNTPKFNSQIRSRTPQDQLTYPLFPVDVDGIWVRTCVRLCVTTLFYISHCNTVCLALLVALLVAPKLLDR